MKNLSGAAEAALINVGTNRIGAPVIAGSVKVFHEMVDAKLIGRTTGLTRKGSIVREQLVSAALERAFG